MNAPSIEDEKPYIGETGASAYSCVVNLTNTIIGAGMLGLPGAYAGLGYITGTTFLILGAFFSASGLRLLSISAEKAGLPSSFYSVAIAAVPRFTILIDFAVALKCFGVATGYLITVGDCMVDAFEFILRSDDGALPSGFMNVLVWRRFWVAAGLLCVLPFSFFRTFDALRFTSTISLGLALMLSLGVVAYAHGWIADPCEGFGMGGFDDMAQAETKACRGETEFFTSPSNTLHKMPIVVFAFTCHQNMFPIVNEIKDRSQMRLNGVISTAIGSALAVYLVVAIEGYRTYGSRMSGDLLLSYPQTHLVTIMRVLIAAMVIFHYPLQLDPSRRCVLSLMKSVGTAKERCWPEDDEEAVFEDAFQEMPPLPLHNNIPSNSGQSAVDENGRAVPQTVKNENTSTGETRIFEDCSQCNPFMQVTCTFLALSFVIAMVVDDLGFVLAMVGATGSVTVSYILPGAIYIKLHPSEFTLSVLLAWMQLILGCMIMTTAIYILIV